LIVAVLSLVVLPSNRFARGPNPSSVVWSGSRLILRSRSIWGLAIGLAGIVAAGYVTADYLAQYFSQAHPSWGISTAALIVTVGLGFTIPGGILGGWIGERGFERRTTIAVFTAICGGGVLLIPYIQLPFYFLLYAVTAVAYGIANAVMFMIPSYLEESRGEGIALGIGIMNSVQLLFSSAFAGIFGLVAFSQGFTDAWILTGLTTLVLLPFLTFVKSSRARRSDQSGDQSSHL
jgi:MFS family permease